MDSFVFSSTFTLRRRARFFLPLQKLVQLGDWNKDVAQRAVRLDQSPLNQSPNGDVRYPAEIFGGVFDFQCANRRWCSAHMRLDRCQLTDYGKCRSFRPKWIDR